MALPFAERRVHKVSSWSRGVRGLVAAAASVAMVVVLSGSASALDNPIALRGITFTSTIPGPVHVENFTGPHASVRLLQPPTGSAVAAMIVDNVSAYAAQSPSGMADNVSAEELSLAASATGGAAGALLSPTVIIDAEEPSFIVIPASPGNLSRVPPSATARELSTIFGLVWVDQAPDESITIIWCDPFGCNDIVGILYDFEQRAANMSLRIREVDELRAGIDDHQAELSYWLSPWQLASIRRDLAGDIKDLDKQALAAKTDLPAQPLTLFPKSELGDFPQFFTGKQTAIATGLIGARERAEAAQGRLDQIVATQLAGLAAVTGFLALAFALVQARSASNAAKAAVQQAEYTRRYAFGELYEVAQIAHPQFFLPSKSKHSTIGFEGRQQEDEFRLDDPVKIPSGREVELDIMFELTQSQSLLGIEFCFVDVAGKETPFTAKPQIVSTAPGFEKTSFTKLPRESYVGWHGDLHIDYGAPRRKAKGEWMVAAIIVKGRSEGPFALQLKVFVAEAPRPWEAQLRVAVAPSEP